MFCNKCGNPLKEDARFCPACGNAVRLQTVAVEPPCPEPLPVTSVWEPKSDWKPEKVNDTVPVEPTPPEDEAWGEFALPDWFAPAEDIPLPPIAEETKVFDLPLTEPEAQCAAPAQEAAVPMEAFMPQPVAEPAPQPVAESIEPAPQPVAEPVEPAPQPAAEPIEPAPQPAAEPVEPAPQEPIAPHVIPEPTACYTPDELPPFYNATQPFMPVYTEPAKARPALLLPTNRSLVKMIFLGLVTFGIYNLVILSRLPGDLNLIASRYDGRRTMDYFAMVLLSTITLGIVPLVWYTRLCSRAGTELERRGIDYHFGPKYFWLWNILGAFIIVGPYIFTHKLMKSFNYLSADYNEKG